MSTLPASMVDSGTPADKPAAGHRGLPALLAAAAALLVAALAWKGGLAGCVGAGAVAAAAVLAVRRLPESAATTTQSDVADVPGRVGAEVMVSQVVPVWSRQMETTRDAADAGLAKLLEGFSEIAGALDKLSGDALAFSPTAEPGTINTAVQAQSPALSALLEASERAFRQRDEAVAVLGGCADALSELQQQAKHAREIARHTRLVAFNASIEAHRGQQGSNGSQAVANELRELAARMAASGESIDRLVLQLSRKVVAARRDGETHDTSAEELRLELELKAREALQLMLGSLGAALQGGSGMREISAALREQLDESFVNFQFGDRISQMLSIVANDMLNFAHWVAANPRATQTDAAQWLEALAASYTMEEQRAQHHGNVHIDRGHEVQFF